MTLTLGAGVIGGVVAGSAGIANAAGDTLSGATISATSAPSISSTGTNQAAGNLTIGIGAASSLSAGDVLDLTVAATTGTITWNTTPSVSTSGITDTGVVLNGTDTVLEITLGASTGTAATITVSGITYNTSGATGTETVVPSITYVTTGTGSFSPAAVTNATLPATPPTTPTFGLTALTTPTIGAGVNSQTAGNLDLTLTGGSGEGWISGDEVQIEVNDTNNANCTGNDYIYWAATPTATVTGTSDLASGSSTPTFTTALGYSASAPACNSLEPNDLVLTFTNSGSFSAASTPNVTILITGVEYSVGSATPVGAVYVGAYYGTSTSATAVVTASKTGATSGPSNAYVSSVIVTANSPAVNVAPSALDAAISPISIVEASASQVPAGYVCVALGGTANAFNTATTPTVTATGGNGAVSTSAVTFTTTLGGATNNTAVFQITSESTGTAGTTYTLSNLAVNAQAATGAVDVTVSDGASTNTCTGETTINPSSTVVAFSVVSATTVISGADADGTAVAEMEQEFPPASSVCPASNSVVLATDSNYPDALAGAYLARYLGTGELLTPTASLSAETATAIRLEGIKYVYVVGGPLAISTAVVTQLEGTQAYNCDGNGGLTSSSGAPVDLQVTQIYGQTEYDTAQDIAQFVPSSYVGTIAGNATAYAGVNSSSGNGAFNDTSGNGSTAPATSGSLRTAILATGQTWQDAESVSSLAYAERLPILLTTPSGLSTQAQAAIQTLGIQQVIVMGGPIAVSNAVVTSLQGLGVSVLRIAGQDYTDTADMLANFEVSTSSTGGLGIDPESRIAVARGDFYTDGLAGAVVEATGGVAYTTAPGVGSTLLAPCTSASTGQCMAPLLLTISPSSLGTYLPTWLALAGSAAGVNNAITNGGPTPGDKISTLIVLGGPLAVTPSQISTIQSDL